MDVVGGTSGAGRKPAAGAPAGWGKSATGRAGNCGGAADGGTQTGGDGQCASGAPVVEVAQPGGRAGNDARWSAQRNANRSARDAPGTTRASEENCGFLK
jgi:hypothetical protein